MRLSPVRVTLFKSWNSMFRVIFIINWQVTRIQSLILINMYVDIRSLSFSITWWNWFSMFHEGKLLPAFICFNFELSSYNRYREKILQNK